MDEQKQPDGDYVVIRHQDTPQTRADAASQLHYNGCKRIRFVRLDDGRLSAHGYLRGD